MKNITSYLSTDKIAILTNANHDQVINKLLELLKSSTKIQDHKKLKELILERENIISTGIGVGLAIPHARKDIIDDFVVAAVLIKNGCNWNSIDSNPVHFAILIASPQDTHREYLRILAQTVLFWKDIENRKKILNATTPEEIMKELSSIQFELN